MVRETIQKQSIEALKARDKRTRSLLGGVLAAFIEEEKKEGFSGFTEESERAIVSRYVKQLQGAVDQMGDRPVAQDYRDEIALLSPYMPQLLSEDETRALIAPLAEQARGLGQFMGLVMKDHKGKVDPKLVRAIGQELGLS